MHICGGVLTITFKRKKHNLLSCKKQTDLATMLKILRLLRHQGWITYELPGMLVD